MPDNSNNKAWLKDGDSFLAYDFNKVLEDVSNHREELTEVEKRLETKQRGLFEVGIEVMSKRLKEAEERNADLERQLAKKDEQIEKLVDIVINKLGGVVE